MNNKQQAAELAAQAYQLDKLMREEQGLMPLIQSGFRGGLKPLMILAYLLALLLTVAIVFCAYQFFTVEAAQQNFWGFCLMLAFQAQVGTKIWIWLEMNRTSTVRELKRVELALAQLQAQAVAQAAAER
ncbi:MAG TPA: hypothetical protein DF774_07730 [Rheinheimera sp.]|uniref:DUF6768 family protein n=1 Tax=Rheinheimera sp. TaxID=1869214 RepID=UPI000EC4A9CF|nr:DUF6768 family protein [Rheinheimera sp.]HCU65631.1 hypothetical protein [Rheinheimera sp.]